MRTVLCAFPIFKEKSNAPLDLRSRDQDPLQTLRYRNPESPHNAAQHLQNCESHVDSQALQTLLLVQEIQNISVRSRTQIQCKILSKDKSIGKENPVHFSS
jgi:hypothetical protein